MNSLCDECKIVQDDLLERGYGTQVICKHGCINTALVIDVKDEADLSAIFNANDETTDKLIAALRGAPPPPPGGPGVADTPSPP